MVYDPTMQNQDIGIIASALNQAMELRKMSNADLARASGVDKSTISLILAGARPNTPALIVAKLARGLNVSVDFLVGLTEDTEPKALQLGEIILELTQVAKQLTSRRQRDLLITARSYLQASAELQGNPDLLMENLLDMIKEAGGEPSYERLLDLLNTDIDNDDDDPTALGLDSPPDNP